MKTAKMVQKDPKLSVFTKNTRNRIQQCLKTHRGHHAAGADAVIEASPLLVVRILSLVQHVLVASIIGLLIGHPATTLNSYGVAATEVVLHLRAVTAALMVTTLEVPVFIEDNLRTTDGWTSQDHHGAVSNSRCRH